MEVSLAELPARHLPYTRCAPCAPLGERTCSSAVRWFVDGVFLMGASGQGAPPGNLGGLGSLLPNSARVSFRITEPSTVPPKTPCCLLL